MSTSKHRKKRTAKRWSGRVTRESNALDLKKRIFASDDPLGSPLLRYAVGGMGALLEESMAIFAPNANSYKRFQANLYAPVAPTWGVNNRTVGFRVTAGPAASRCPRRSRVKA